MVAGTKLVDELEHTKHALQAFAATSGCTLSMVCDQANGSILLLVVHNPPHMGMHHYVVLCPCYQNEAARLDGDSHGCMDM